MSEAKTFESNMENKEWCNYGDIGYLDEGGVQVKPSDLYENAFDVVLLTPHPEDENKMLAGHTVVFIDDYKEDENIINRIKEAWGEDYAYTDMDIAAIAAEQEGLIGMGMTAFNENEKTAAYSIKYEDFEIDKLILAQRLVEMGIDIEESLADLKAERAANITEALADPAKSSEERGALQQELVPVLASAIEQVMFELGEYDCKEECRIAWLDSVPSADEIAASSVTLMEARKNVTACVEQALEGTASEEIGGIESLMEYLNDNLNTMDPADELVGTYEKLLVHLNRLFEEQIEELENKRPGQKSSEEIEK